MSFLKYDPEIYTPKGLRKNLSFKEAREEYSRLRSIALKRIKRFEGTEYEDSDILKEFPKEQFLTVKEIGDDRRLLNYLLLDTVRFLNKKRSTVSGQRQMDRKVLKTLESHGYDFVNSSNLQEFGRFMQIARARSTARYFDSIRAAETFGESRTKDIEELAQEFKEWENENIRQRL